jgi:hypothetical protein
MPTSPIHDPPLLKSTTCDLHLQLPNRLRAYSPPRNHVRSLQTPSPPPKKLTTPQKRHLRPLRRRRRDRTGRLPPNPNLAIHLRSPRPHSPLHRDPRPPIPRIRRPALPPGAPPTRPVRKRRALSLTHRLVYHR